MTEPTLDILICSIVHRTDMLTELLAELERQRQPGVGVRVFRDNLETVYGTKCQALLDSSSADYVCFLDDDDWPYPDYVAAIFKALERKPDYVGFQVRYTEDGVPQVPVYHTLRYDGWEDRPDGLFRDIVHFNPIRRDLAVQSKWQGGDGADRVWAEGLRKLGHVRFEVYIDRQLLHYRHRSADTFHRSSNQAPMPEPPPAPDAPWVTWLT